MRRDEFTDNMVRELGIAVDKVSTYNSANALYHCGRIAYLAYALSRYIAFRDGLDVEDETSYMVQEVE